jgi:hypothetical protein
MLSGLMLNVDEVARARTVFRHCDTYKEKRINQEQFGIALALLGISESSERVREIFLRYSKELVDDHMTRPTYLLALRYALMHVLTVVLFILTKTSAPRNVLTVADINVLSYCVMSCRAVSCFV